MKVLEKNRAIKLRKEGRTYREILQEVSVSKGSLSFWLKDIHLTDEQISRIQYKNEKIREKFLQFNKDRKAETNNNNKAVFNNAFKEVGIISARELKLTGIALYWAEGYKKDGWRTVSFTNSDEGMIKVMMKWFREICEVYRDRFRIRVQCHGFTKVKECEQYWSKVTGVPLRQFTKSYIKISSSSKRKMGEGCPYGICHIRISDADLLVKIKGWIRGLGMAPWSS